jgi:hypothetical protein
MSVLIAELPIEDDAVIEEINCRLRITRHMALAFFASAWADWNDECGDVNVSGKDIFNVMPDEIDPEALKAAYQLAEGLEITAGKGLHELLEEAQAVSEGGDLPCDEEHFGHYCAMQAMGHGVGIESVGLDHDWIKVPDIEFGSCSLDPVKYPLPDD